MGNERNVIKMGLPMDIRVWSNFKWEFAAAILGGFFGVVFNQFYIPLAIQHGASNFQVGIMTAAPALGLLFAPFWASIVEKGKLKPFVIIPNLAARILILLPVFYTVPLMFILATFGINFLMGIQAPAYAGLMTRIYPAELRGRLMGYVRVGSGAMMIPLVYLVGRWIDSSGSSSPILIASVTGFVSILMFIGFKEMASSQETQLMLIRRRATLLDQLRLIRGNRDLALFLTVTTFVGFGNMLGVPLFQIIQVGQLKLSNLEIGYIRMVYYLCLLIGYLAVGRIVDHYSPRRALLIVMAMYLTIPLTYALFNNFSGVVAAGGMNGIADAFWDIGCFSYVFRIAPGREAVVFALHLMLVGIRGTVAPLLSTSLIHTISFQNIFFTGAFFILCGLVLFAYSGGKSSESIAHAG